MAERTLANYLRTHRRKSGFTQRELASILGYGEDAVYCHENAKSTPPLLTALAYEAIFRVPVSELFPSMYQGVERQVEARLVELESRLQEKSARDRDANATARKLEWLWTRRSGIEI